MTTPNEQGSGTPPMREEPNAFDKLQSRRMSFADQGSGILSWQDYQEITSLIQSLRQTLVEREEEIERLKSLLREPTAPESWNLLYEEQQRLRDENTKLREERRSPTDIKLRAKLIDLLHRYGTGETEEHDGEQIDQMVERLIYEIASLQSQLAAAHAERDEALELVAKAARTSLDQHKQLAAAREDTERLDWLEKRVNDGFETHGAVTIQPASAGMVWMIDYQLSYPFAPTLRAAIDAAQKPTP